VNRYVRKDGSVVDVLWSASWSESDKIMFCVAHDVTERARIEKELREAKENADRANRAKSEFLSRMSHELRTPLNAILGFGQLLERQSPTDAQRDRVGYIMSAGRHLLNLINEVLDISRIEAGNLQLSLEPVCVAEALAEALELMRPMATERGVNLAAPSMPESNLHVLGDRQRFKQVLLNLLTNAIKYTPRDGKIVVSWTTPPGERLRLMVSDTGPGIPADKLSRVFTPFDRLGAEQSAIEGTGLGLALSQRLMHAMNGEIGIETAVVKGSTFWIELPLTESPLERISVQKRDVAQRTEADPARRTVLYIEDNISNLTLVEQLLEEKPEIRLISAMQGRLGLDLARQHGPDLILLDLHLPDLPGWDVLAQLKENEVTSRIPVIVISADATKRQIDRLMSRGASSYLTKPIEVPEFFRVLDQTLGLSAEAKEFAAA
jgi:signal transduction histidine kinase/ActR/RegA family two-component response regulator